MDGKRDTRAAVALLTSGGVSDDSVFTPPLMSSNDCKNTVSIDFGDTNKF